MEAPSYREYGSVTPRHRGGNQDVHRGVRFLHHADVSWFEDALEDFVNDVTDRVVVKETGNVKRDSLYCKTRQ